MDRLSISLGSLKARLYLSIALLISLIFTAAASFVYQETHDNLVERALVAHQRSVQALARNLEDRFDATKQQSRMLLSVFRNEYLQGANIPGTTVRVGDYDLSEVLVQGEPVSSNIIVDKFAQDTGWNATLLVVNNQQLVSLSSSMLNHEGRRLIGVVLDIGSQAYQSLVNGEEYFHKQRREETDYIHFLAPVLNDHNQLVAAVALTLNVSEVSQSLFDSLAQLKWGDTGYSLVFENAEPRRGNFLLHPLSHEIGQNVVARANADKPFQKLFEAPTGIITYPHQHLGKEGQKYLAYSRVKGWDWVIAGGTFFDELDQGSTGLRNMMIAVAVVSAMVTLLLIRIIFSHLLKPIFQDKPKLTAFHRAYHWLCALVSPKSQPSVPNVATVELQQVVDDVKHHSAPAQWAVQQLLQQTQADLIEADRLLQWAEQFNATSMMLNDRVEQIFTAVDAGEVKVDEAMQAEIGRVQTELAQSEATIAAMAQRLNEADKLLVDCHHAVGVTATNCVAVSERLRYSSERLTLLQVSDSALG